MTSNEKQKKIQEIYEWVDIVIENKEQEDKFKFAAFSGLANRIEDFFLEIKYWTKLK